MSWIFYIFLKYLLKLPWSSPKIRQIWNIWLNFEFLAIFKVILPQTTLIITMLIYGNLLRCFQNHSQVSVEYGLVDQNSNLPDPMLPPGFGSTHKLSLIFLLLLLVGISFDKSGKSILRMMVQSIRWTADNTAFVFLSICFIVLYFY